MVRRSRLLGFAAWCVVLTLSVFLAACGGSSSSSSNSSSSEESASTTVQGEPIGEGLLPAKSKAVEELPAELQAFYKGTVGNIGPSPLVTFKSTAKPPYTIGYASTYAGNTWRSTVLNELEKVLIPEYEKMGLVDKLLVTQSNGDVATQIQNEKQLLDQGADVLLTVAPPPGLDKSIEYAYEKGVPYVAFDGPVKPAMALNTGVNYYLGGYEETRSLAQEIGGKGNVLLVSGIPGVGPSELFNEGAKQALKEFPEIQLVGEVAGMWTDPIAKSEVLKFLATHPEELNGIIAQAATEVGTLQALEQSGREIVPMTIGGEVGAMCYWRNHPDWLKHGFLIWPPSAEPSLGLRAALRTLLGQGPKIQTITRPQFTVDYKEVKERVPASCSEEDTNWVPLEQEEWFSNKMLDSFFAHPFELDEWEKRVN